MNAQAVVVNGLTVKDWWNAYYQIHIYIYYIHMVRWMDGQLEAWMDGWMSGWTNSLMDGWMDGWTVGNVIGR